MGFSTGLNTGQYTHGYRNQGAVFPGHFFSLPPIGLGFTMAGMDSGYLILFGCGIGILSFLFWMLFSLKDSNLRNEKDKIRGSCPICGQGLKKGERIRSNVTEIGDIEIQTHIKGCPYCMGSIGKRRRSCPVCKKKLKSDAMILAISDPRVDRKKLSIRGCKKCYPQGF